MRSRLEDEPADERPEALQLLRNIKAQLPELERLEKDTRARWYEDGIYRFYHQSFKVYALQEMTSKIVCVLKAIAPTGDGRLNAWFLQIVSEGTGRKFRSEDNRNWISVTRPMVEAYFHALYFLEMAIKYGKEYERPPAVMDSGWAALLYLYNMR